MPVRVEPNYESKMKQKMLKNSLAYLSLYHVELLATSFEINWFREHTG